MSAVNDVKAEVNTSTSDGNSGTSAAAAVSQAAAYVIVCDTEGGTPVELPLETDSSLLTDTLQIEYTGANGLKYRNPETGIFRIVAPQSGKLFPPPGGWAEHHFIACTPKNVDERPWEQTSESAASVQQTMKRIAAFEAHQSAPPIKRTPAAGGPVSFYGGRGGVPAPSANFVRPRGMTPRGRGIPRGAGMPFNSSPRGAIRPPAPNRGAPAPHSSKFDFCDVCQVGMNSSSQAEAHYTGKKHLDAAAGRGGGGPRGRGVAGRGRGRGAPMMPHTNFADDVPTVDFSAQASKFASMF